MSNGFRIKNIRDERAYHNTAILIYLKAVRDVLGDVNVRIGNSLNQGYFTYIDKKKGNINATDIHRIWNRMEAIVREDHDVEVDQCDVDKARRKWEQLGYHEKAELLDVLESGDTVEIADIDGYRNCMYSALLPKTGMIDIFELRPYRNGLLLRLPNALRPETLPDYRDDDKLYDAYAETKRVRKEIGLHYLADTNRVIAEGNSVGLIRANEWFHNHIIEGFASQIVENGRRIVLISGPSSSGKTTFAKRLCKAISQISDEPLYLGTDDYFVERDQTPLGPDGEPDFEGLGALDLELFNEQMEALIAGKEVDLPEFDFIKGSKIFGKRIMKAGENQIIVIEGIHSLNEDLTANIPAKQKFKIYISPLTLMGVDRHNRLSTADTRLLRRMVRDNQFRGNSAEATLEAWPKVRAGESVNVFPYSSSADIVFNSSTMYETNLLKTYAEPLLKAIPESSAQYPEAQRILNFLRFFRPITSAEAVPEYSIIREFIGKD
ncbi:MAG: nucleoside kinase [Clostridiales bacterium]|nr:nucleoside kinase [Clostridiales bacterium]